MRWLDIWGKFGQHAVLRAETRYKGSLRAAVKAAASQVEVVVWNGGERHRVFRGEVVEVDAGAEIMTIKAHGTSYMLDQTQRTCSYGGGPQMQHLAKLKGIDKRLKGVKGTKYLNESVGQVYQVNESDFDWITRVAADAGLAVNAPAVGPLALLDGKGKAVKVKRQAIVPRSERIRARRCSPAARFLTADVESGRIAARGELVKAKTTKGDLLAELLSMMGIGDPHEFYLPSFGRRHDDRRRADQLVREEMGRMLRWKADLTAPYLHLQTGDLIKLDDNAPLDDALIIESHHISYRPLRPLQRQLINHVSCGPARFLPIRTRTRGNDALIWMLGQVADVRDPNGQARVKVSFGWHRREGSPQRWEGIWSNTCRPSAGKRKGKRKPHGSVAVPQPTDWVLTVFDPHGYEPPLVLTSVYHGRCGKTPHVKDPELETMLISSPGGVVSVARDPAHGQPASFVVAIEEDGNILAEIHVVGETVKIRGAKIILEGDVDIEGKLVVKKDARFEGKHSVDGG